MKYYLTLFLSVFLLSCTTQNPTKYSKIQYEAGACFGFCPIFKMTINPDRTAVIEAEHFTFTKNHSKGEFSEQKEGTFTATIKQADYNKMINLLNSADLRSLKDHYKNRNVSDLPTSYLRINFTDGTSKNIEDYGKNGTPKLKEIYEIMENLRLDQTWKKID
ncbi:hypothetical protein IV494_01195 [Kaistella sp. G5-32]|uniref:DUF6438 domain-containing protein n=1 Tax=Kaistella gelatinilytica TaxID=2787636 RepID=A0ABS0F7V2_9FLAO|nr:DUF6438 domain-containing protein [Kaistella gelatinilytica]MBF8455783.1 hypothetical protein [Kaistella gelatinilytica]